MKQLILLAVVGVSESPNEHFFIFIMTRTIYNIMNDNDVRFVLNQQA